MIYGGSLRVFSIIFFLLSFVDFVHSFLATLLYIPHKQMHIYALYMLLYVLTSVPSVS